MPCLPDAGQRAECHQPAAVAGRTWWGLFLIKELVIVTLVLADTRDNHQDPVPWRCVANRRRSSPPGPALTLPFSLYSASQAARGAVTSRFHPEERAAGEKGRG